jgi:hypothetical protein
MLRTLLVELAFYWEVQVCSSSSQNRSGQQAPHPHILYSVNVLQKARLSSQRHGLSVAHSYSSHAARTLLGFM